MNLDRLLRRHTNGSGAPEPSETDQPESGELPAGRYDRMAEKDVNSRLRGHSQVELEAIETHERSHKNRTVVLNKLRYLRGKEPLAGYDTLEADQVAEALRDADVETIRAVREYERKFGKREAVLSQLDAIGRERRATLAAGR